MDNGHITYPNGVEWYIKSYDEEVIKKIKESVESDKTVAFGMKVYKQATDLTPNFGPVFRFEVDSPVLTRTK